MGFLKDNTIKIILFCFCSIFCFLIVRQLLDPNYPKYKYFNQHCNGIVISNFYDKTTHFNIIRSSDDNKIYLEDLKIISLINLGDSIVKNKNVTFFTVYKKDKRKVIYDMYNKQIKILK
ncbi:hypothetical protein [Chryseobacterium gregarium]|uniref:hypothetical protein n=1 Tax=Chryseobacterium gregarium TaxID=456299 RepID=UPI0004800F93|nr:hypothetical protein [Chryseobacterium gregarium]